MARVLIVDDDPAHINIWRILLEAKGHHIDTAVTVGLAMEKLSVVRPDILLMDLRVPELKDGVALIRKARESEQTKIVVLSGWPQDLESLPEHKFVHRILAKPVRPDTLLRHIAELVATMSACYGILLALA